MSIHYRTATLDDLNALVDLEENTFSGDRISKRSFKNYLKSTKVIFLIAEDGKGLVGYGLVLLHKGTRLARLYSLAVNARARGLGIGEQLLLKLEDDTRKRNRFYLRLEVAKNNAGAIALYEKLGYRVFGEHADYYEDHTDALRMQKRIRHAPDLLNLPAMRWCQQTTPFTCGPASLMMAMHSLNPNIEPQQNLELQLWREATTIFMTSGHGGCHPLGLAIAAQKRGFKVTALVNTAGPLFVEGVRTDYKKNIIALVDQQFRQEAADCGAEVRIEELTQNHLHHWLNTGHAVLLLISTYRLDGKKVPHWVTVTGMDEHCFYVHDPDPDDRLNCLIDCQHIPIAREDFAKMAAFGGGRLRTAIALKM